MRKHASVLLLTGLLTAVGWAQSPATQSDLNIQEVRVTVADNSGRSFQSGEIRIALTGAESTNEAINVGGVEFLPGAEKRYPLRDGVATARLIVPVDSGRSLSYVFRASGPQGRVCASRTVAVSVSTREVRILSTNCNAPATSTEIYGAAFFGIAALGLIVTTFFYWGFRRMLFGRRMEVSSASLWSNILTLFYLVVASGTILAAYLTPSLLAPSAQSTYIGLVMIFVGIYLLGFLFLMLMTRTPAVRGEA